jgi:hypothetical protein
MKQMQHSTATSIVRHHHEYRIISTSPVCRPIRRILSFGCLTGEEPVTFKKFLPDAEIFGVDINREALASACANYGQLITFLEPDHRSVLAHGPYDLVTAMSVLCRHPPEFQSGRQIGLGFGLWSDALPQIDGCLDEEGLLLLYNSNFAFRRHPVAAKYQAIRDPRCNEACFVSQFDESGRLLAEGRTVGPAAAHLGVFQWYERDLDSGDLGVWDLHDLCFQKSSRSAITRLSVDSEAPDELLLATGVFAYDPHAAGLLKQLHRSLCQRSEPKLPTASSQMARSCSTGPCNEPGLTALSRSTFIAASNLMGKIRGSFSKSRDPCLNSDCSSRGRPLLGGA